MSTPPAGIPEVDWLSWPPEARQFTLAQQQELQALRQENDELRRHLTALATELAQLRERVNRSSRNSSKPPSSDGPGFQPPGRRKGSGRHPLLEQGLESLHIELSQQQAEGGVRRRLGDVGAEQLVESVAVPFGETLYAQQRTQAAQDGEDRHQQHPPLREAHPTAHATVGQRLEKADQIGCGSRVLEWGGQR